MTDYNMGTLTLDADGDEGLDIAIWDWNKQALSQTPPGTVYDPTVHADRTQFARAQMRQLFNQRYRDRFRADFKDRTIQAFHAANRLAQGNVATELNVTRNPYTALPPGANAVLARQMRAPEPEPVKAPEPPPPSPVPEALPFAEPVVQEAPPPVVESPRHTERLARIMEMPVVETASPPVIVSTAINKWWKWLLPLIGSGGALGYWLS